MTTDQMTGILLSAILDAIVPRCACCSSTDNLEWCDSRTCYDPRRGGEEEHGWWQIWFANPPTLLCPECAEEHHAYWDEMWAEYYAGQG